MRTIKSFVRREGRMTCAQQLAFTTFWPQYGIDVTPGVPLDFAKIFGRNAPCALEIGFGNGEALIAMAKLRPDVDFIGVEVYQSGTGGLFQQLNHDQIQNVRVIHTDVMTLFPDIIPENSLNHVYIYFPDPWPKRKHVKRRLVQTAFLDQLKTVLVPGGCVHFATDWLDYARHAQAVFSNHPDFKAVMDPTPLPYYCPRPSTKFYRRALQLGHVITDLSVQADKPTTL